MMFASTLPLQNVVCIKSCSFEIKLTLINIFVKYFTQIYGIFAENAHVQEIKPGNTVLLV